MHKILVFMVGLSVGQLAWAGNCKAPEATSIKDLAAGAPELSTLVAAVAKTGYLDFLDGNRMLTVFAPDNAAFDATAQLVLEDETALGIDLVNALDADTLAAILAYHISPGERDAEDVLASSRIRTLSKEFTFPSLQEGAPFINDSSIEVVDLPACNGIVHIISGSVLLPPSL